MYDSKKQTHENYLSLRCPSFRYSKCYVDKMMVNRVQMISRILRVLNSIHPKHRVSMGDEINGTLPFPSPFRPHQSRLHHHHKQIWSGRHLNFQSSLPLSYKRNTVRVLELDLADESIHKKNFGVIRDTTV